MCVHAVAGWLAHSREAHLSTGVNPQCVLSNQTSAAPEDLLEDSLMLVWVGYGSTNFANFLVDSEVVITVRLLH